MKKLFSFLSVLIICSCNAPDDHVTTADKTVPAVDTTAKSYPKLLGDLEQQSSELDYASLGEIIKKIRFEIKSENAYIVEDGISPYIRIDSPDVELAHLTGKDEIVINESKVFVIIDYPLTKAAKFELKSPNGFTKAQLVKFISDNYIRIYEEEERTAAIKTLPMEQREMENRNVTDGKYGIWGHDLRDLVLSEIDVYKTSDGKIILTLEIES